MRAAAMLSFCALAGCPGMTSRDRLVSSIYRYNEGVRWGRYDQAASERPPEQRDSFLRRMRGAGALVEITEYDIEAVEVDGEGASAAVHVTLAWMRPREGLLKRTRLVQVWREREGQWLLCEERRVAGDPVPVVAEPTPAPQPAPAGTPAPEASAAAGS